MPTRMNEIFYKTTIRLDMTYGEECRPIGKQYNKKMSVSKDVDVEMGVWLK